MKNNEITALIYDARGNGDGGVSPTLTGDHQNRITDYTAILLEIHEEDTDDSQRPRGGHNPMGYKRHFADIEKSDEAPRTDCGFGEYR